MYNLPWRSNVSTNGSVELYFGHFAGATLQLLYFTLHYSAYSTLAFELYSTLLWRTGRSWANLSTVFQFLRFREIVVGFWAELFDFCHFLEQRRT